MVNDPESALIYAKKHYEIAELLGDKAGLASAKLNIEEFEEIISQKQAAQLATSHHHHQQRNINSSQEGSTHAATTTNLIPSKKLNPDSMNTSRLTPDKRQEQEQRRFKKQLNSNLAADIDGLAARRRGGRGGERGAVRSSSSERLFDMIAHFQSGRIDDQRCEILKKPNNRPDSVKIGGATTTSRIVDDKENLVSTNTSESTSTNGSASGGFNKGAQPSITNPMNAVSAAASAIKATYRKASLAAYPTSVVPSIQSQRRPTVSAEHREQLFDLIAGAQGQRMDEQRASLPALTLANGTLKNPTSAGLLGRGHHTLNQSTSAKIRQQQFDPMPETIIEVQPRGKSHSIVPQSTATPSTISKISKDTSNAPQANKPKPQKLTRHFQTVDSDAQVHDEKFLDSLMKYQSTRFNDQRSEFPNKGTHNSGPADKDKGQADNFFNLIVRFQSDRIDDQRSAPPAGNKNI